MRLNRISMACVLVAALCGAPTLGAQDQPSAIVVYPYVATDSTAGIDTTVQLTNVSNDRVEARCFYEDLTPECVNGSTGESCGPGPVTCSGFCVPREVRRPFRVRLTPRQPLAWRVSTGLTALPLDGVERVGPTGTSNQFTDVPALGAGPMVGTLRCVLVQTDPYLAARENVLVGLATIEQRPTSVADTEAMQYRAIGLRAVSAGPDRDEFLRLGGSEAEYEGWVRSHERARRYVPGRYLFETLSVRLRPLDHRAAAGPSTPDPDDPAVQKNQVAYFLNALETSPVDISYFRIILFELNGRNEHTEWFLNKLREEIARGTHPPWVRRIVLVDVAARLTPADFYVLDDHLTPGGHRKVAQILLPYVQGTAPRAESAP